MQVKDPARTFPKALFIAVIIVVLNYALPIMAFTAVDPHFELYQNGYFVEVRALINMPLCALCQKLSPTPLVVLMTMMMMVTL
jgi:amino acid transporter